MVEDPGERSDCIGEIHLHFRLRHGCSKWRLRRSTTSAMYYEMTRYTYGVGGLPFPTSLALVEPQAWRAKGALLKQTNYLHAK